MKILQVHKYLYPRDGASTYLFGISELLKQHGHEVEMWGTKENYEITRLRNYEYLQIQVLEDLLMEPLNFDRREGFWKDLKKFFHMVWSFEAARKFECVVREFKPDVIHIHNIYHHISPAILPVARRLKIPVVMTVHDYHLVNPNYTLYDHKKICERQGLRAIAHRCIKNSFAATTADVIEWSVHHFMKVYEKNVERFIVPTEFVKEKLVEGGMDSARIEVVPLPLVSPTPPNLPSVRGGNESISPPLGGGVRGGQAGSYILFAGRLAEEKGVYVILEIAKHLPDIQFKIAGSGPEFENVKCKIKNEKLLNVELLGFVEKEKLQSIIEMARLVIVPSLWYDPSPYAVLEAMEAGKVVVASMIGGISELVEDGKSGFLLGANYESIANLRISNSEIRKFEPHSQFAPQWIDTIQKIYYDESLLKRIGEAARQYIKEAHDPEKHYERLIEIYRKISNSSNF
ncbi:MAG: glycosyltransferase [bacterium]|nr:glycosyltransferase [bacterium]